MAHRKNDAAWSEAREFPTLGIVFLRVHEGRIIRAECWPAMSDRLVWRAAPRKGGDAERREG